jgi:MFS family permease
MYSNSSFLSLFVDERTVGIIYMLGAAISILGFLFISDIVRIFGNYRTTIAFIILQMILFAGMIFTKDSTVIIICNILQSAVISMIGLNLDIFLEGYTAEGHVGSTRGLYTATLNTSWVIAPLLGSMLINGTNNYIHTYVASLAMLFPLLYLVYRNFPRFKDPQYDHASPWQLTKRIAVSHNWKKLFAANTILQTFYAWMVVYSPIYLHTFMGFGWDTIGIILVIMLIPFPIIQYPLGKMSDRLGEKKIMITGFIIMGLSTIALAFVTTPNLLLWSTLLLITRIGAAASEIMMETYFFKKAAAKDAPILGAFRITRPFAYFLAPLVMGGSLLFTTHQYVFVIVGLISFLAIFPVTRMEELR